MKFQDTSLIDYTRFLASSSPVPGGGGACGAACAIGIALAEMTGELCLKRMRKEKSRTENVKPSAAVRTEKSSVAYISESKNNEQSAACTSEAKSSEQSSVCTSELKTGEQFSVCTSEAKSKEQSASSCDDVEALLARADSLRKRLAQLIDEDADNFLPLSKAYSIPKDAPGRAEELERCTLLALKSPLEIFDIACECAELAAEFAAMGNRLSASDAGVGSALILAAAYGAAVNVRVNTKFMKDREYAEKLNRSVDERLKKLKSLAEHSCEYVYKLYE